MTQFWLYADVFSHRFFIASRLVVIQKLLTLGRNPFFFSCRQTSILTFDIGHFREQGHEVTSCLFAELLVLEKRSYYSVSMTDSWGDEDTATRTSGVSMKKNPHTSCRKLIISCLRQQQQLCCKDGIWWCNGHG